MTFDHILDKLKQWKRPWAGGSEPVEIHRAVLEDVEAQVVAVGGGRRIFPFDRVQVRLLAPAPGEKERMEAIVQEGWDLEKEIADRLRAQSARIPAGFAVHVEITDQPAPEFAGRRYALAFQKTAAQRPPAATLEPLAPLAQEGAAAGDASAGDAATPAAAGGGSARREAVEGEEAPFGQAVTEVIPLPRAAGAPAAAPPRTAPPAASPASAPAAPRGVPGVPGLPAIGLAVIKGSAGRDRYDLRAERIYLGRLAEVVDAAGRVMRRNDVAFLEEGELNQTVSREHARIAWDAESRGFWLRDEGSAAGTVIFRAGRSIEVSRHDRRGVRLQDGDEVFLGRAAIKVVLQTN